MTYVLATVAEEPRAIMSGDTCLFEPSGQDIVLTGHVSKVVQSQHPEYRNSLWGLSGSYFSRTPDLDEALSSFIQYGLLSQNRQFTTLALILSEGDIVIPDTRPWVQIGMHGNGPYLHVVACSRYRDDVRVEKIGEYTLYSIGCGSLLQAAGDDDDIEVLHHSIFNHVIAKGRGLIGPENGYFMIETAGIVHTSQDHIFERGLRLTRKDIKCIFGTT